MTEPKKILSCDGGGIKGALTLGLLKRFEEQLRAKYGKDALLCDYFDLIGGTSTGAIISAGLAIGLSVDEIRDHYFTLGDKVFGKKSILGFLFGGGSFTSKSIKQQLQNIFKDIKLDDPSIKTGLAIFAKRIDTQSLWIVYNNPEHKYWKYQKDYLLRESIRASTAAPTYFDAQAIDVKGDGSQIGDFVDGGLSPANNPSLNLFILSTLANYGYGWEKGVDKLALYSFGTGRSSSPELPKGFIKPLGWAQKAPQILMEDMSEQNEILMHLLSDAQVDRQFDRVLKGIKDTGFLQHPLLKYYRYNTEYTAAYLNDKLGYSFSDKEIADLRKMDDPKNVKKLFEIGYKASEQIESTHII